MFWSSLQNNLIKNILVFVNDTRLWCRPTFRRGGGNMPPADTPKKKKKRLNNNNYTLNIQP